MIAERLSLPDAEITVLPEMCETAVLRTVDVATAASTAVSSTESATALAVARTFEVAAIVALPPLVIVDRPPMDTVASETTSIRARSASGRSMMPSSLAVTVE